jgi:hypothetical protein
MAHPHNGKCSENDYKLTLCSAKPLTRIEIQVAAPRHAQ